MFIVKKKIAGKEYYYLRTSERKEGKVKAKTIAYLGKSKKEAEQKVKEIMQKLLKPEKQSIKMEQTKPKESSETQEEKAFLSFISEAGLIWGPEPEIYGGFAGFYTYGLLGKLLKNKVENAVRKIFNSNGLRELEGTTVLPDIVWKASGHLET